MIKYMVNSLITAPLILIGIFLIAYYVQEDTSYWFLAAGNIMTLMGLDLRFKVLKDE